MSTYFRLAVAAGAALLAVGAHAQAFPGSKPVTLIVPFAAGGPTDKVARDLAEALRKPLGGGTVVVENAAGAGSTIGTAKAFRATPDGYTLLLTHVGMATTPTLYRNPGYKYEDFEYLGLVNEVPMVVVGKPALAAKTWSELNTWIAQNQGKVNLGNAGLGSASHLCGLMLQSALKTDMTADEAKAFLADLPEEKAEAPAGGAPKTEGKPAAKRNHFDEQMSKDNPNISGGEADGGEGEDTAETKANSILADYAGLTGQKRKQTA